MKKEKNKNWPKLNAEHIFEEPKTYNPSSSKVKRDWDKNHYSTNRYKKHLLNPCFRKIKYALLETRTSARN